MSKKTATERLFNGLPAKKEEEKKEEKVKSRSTQAFLDSLQEDKECQNQCQTQKKPSV